MSRHRLPRRTGRRTPVVLVGVLAVLAGLLSTSGVTAADNTGGAFTATRTLERFFTEGGERRVVDTRDVTVTVDRTSNLRGRERVRIAWSGARPSAGRSTNPAGEKGMDQEYPVVVLQCRGRDGSGVPAAQRLRPETCWTSTVQQRSQRQVADDAALWRADALATERDRSPLAGVDRRPAACNAEAVGFSDRFTPFVPATGASFAACNQDTMPPEAAVDASYPPAEQAAFTRLDGTGETRFEVRSTTENGSLGCSDRTPCSIVVIPIMGLSCDQTPSRPLNAGCRKTGRFEPGSSNFAGQGVDDAVSPKYWWSESNWSNRITVPITFGPPPNVCDLLDERAPVGFFGSELMRQASLQWAPAYCLRKDRFRFQHNVMPDEAAFTIMDQDQGPAAFVSSGHETSGPVGYAPTAVTGFAVSYVIDRPGNAGEERSLRLNARLLAKLLTQSYPASIAGRKHPGMETNPLSVNLDPEFQALNPGLDLLDREEAAVVMNLSESTDVLTALTTYIDADPEASAFVSGTPDPWGMKVNPSYRGIELPVAEWPLKDTFTIETAQACLQANNDVPYLTRLAAPVTTFAKITDALLDSWPLAQTRCTGLGDDQFPYVLSRADRQGVGSRFLIGITTLADAERAGLDTAALQTNPVKPGGRFTSADGRRFVAPDRSSMAAAVTLARQEKRGQPFAIAARDLQRTPAAYPGTLVVYTAAKTQGLPKDRAALVAGFIRTATTEGQRPGSGNGFLPRGYLPITKKGATAALWAAAQDVAAMIEAQSQDTDGTSGSGGTDVPTGVDAGLGDLPAVAPDDAEAPAADDAAQPTDAQLRSLGSTEGLSSLLAAWMVPLLLLLLLGGALAAPVLRVLAARKVER